MSFGFGVGDILAVAKLCNKLWQDFVDAPHQLQDIARERQGLQIKLQDVESYASIHKLGCQTAEDLSHISHDCESILKDVSELLEKNRVLLHGIHGKQFKRVWRRLKWDPKETQNFRTRITLHSTFLGSFNERICRENTTKLIQNMEEENLKAAMDWLSSRDYSSQQADYLAIREPGTGQWLIFSPEFQAWLKAPGSILFCPGIPGAGKTILTSVVIDYLLKNVQRQGSVGVAYVYLDSQHDTEESLTGVFASILNQLVAQQPSLIHELGGLYSKYPECQGLLRPSFVTVIAGLLLVLNHERFSRIFIVIDGLDESSATGNCRDRLLSNLLNFPRYNCNLFATSRFIAQIETEFDLVGAAKFEIRAIRRDVRNYIATSINSLNSCVRSNEALQDEIMGVILDVVDGMFLLARLYVYLLEDCLTVAAVRKTLNHIREQSRGKGTTDIEKLGILCEAYSRTMERIWKQRPGRRNLAERALTWVITARRPLTTADMQHALAVEENETEFDKDNIPDINDVLSVCAGLVVLDKERDIIRLVHYTAQEYLDSYREQFFPQAHWRVTKTCLRYLSFSPIRAFVTDFSVSGKVYDLFHTPFLRYAEENWAMHLRASEPVYQMDGMVIEYLGSRSRAAPPSYEPQPDTITAFLMQYSLGPSSRDKWPIFHQALFYGFYELAKAIIRNDPEAVNRPDARGRTPLHSAACDHNSQPIGFLLRHGCTEIKGISDIKGFSEDSDHQCPLRGNGKEAASFLISNGARIDHLDVNGMTPLFRAVMNEGVDMARLLLENGANPSLGWAFAHGYHGPLTMLPPLHFAATAGLASMVRLFLSYCPDIVESRDERGGTAMLLACGLGHEETVKVLIEFGADMDLPSTDSVTPLMAAYREGHIKVFNLLVEHANDTFSPGGNGRWHIAIGSLTNSRHPRSSSSVGGQYSSLCSV